VRVRCTLGQQGETHHHQACENRECQYDGSVDPDPVLDQFAPQAGGHVGRRCPLFGGRVAAGRALVVGFHAQIIA
jgi:hypothetical protein